MLFKLVIEVPGVGEGERNKRCSWEEDLEDT